MDTPRSQLFDDVYFSAEDGLAETWHVFLSGNRLPQGWAGKERFTIAETGFGTGLNFLAAWTLWDETASAGQSLSYISVEKYPLSADEIRTALEPWKHVFADRLDALLKNYPLRIGGWHRIELAANVTLLLIFDDANRALPELKASVDAWFLDGFAPAKNPDMWSETVFQAIAINSHSKTTLASFTAAGLVRRGLAEVGFHIEKARGYGRKRDMTIGKFLGGAETEKAPKNYRKIAIIGGGLAGSSIAHELSAVDIETHIYQSPNHAKAASNNVRGLYNPRFTSHRNSISDFYASAFALAIRTFQDTENCEFLPEGALHLITDEDKRKKLVGAFTSWGWHTDHMRMLSSAEASEIAGLPLTQNALFLPDSGTINPSSLCEYWKSGSMVQTTEITDLKRYGSSWKISDQVYDAVVLACGPGLLKLDLTKTLPLQTVRGQVTYISSALSLNTNLCYGGYLTPAHNGQHILGSTFQPWLDDTEPEDKDDAANLLQLRNAVPDFGDVASVSGHRAALRVAAKDRFPVAGLIPGHDNLYISGAHGSHGLVSSTMAAQIIANEILGQVASLPQSTLDLLSPDRFTKVKKKS